MVAAVWLAIQKVHRQILRGACDSTGWAPGGAKVMHVERVYHFYCFKWFSAHILSFILYYSRQSKVIESLWVMLLHAILMHWTILFKLNYYQTNKSTGQTAARKRSHSRDHFILKETTTTTTTTKINKKFFRNKQHICL